nr:CGNR zinc finger domain-containing protein [Flexivirga meconopsidis]
MSLAAAAALVNTVTQEPDPLDDEESFRAFVTRWQWSGPVRFDDAERAAVRKIRPTLRGLWAGDEAETVDRVNAMLRTESALPQLVRHDEWDWHLHATPVEAPLASRWVLDAAMAMVDLVRAGELSRLRTCAADDCDNVLVDLSKNRSRRYCDAGCGNRANVAAYRARQAGR